MGYDECGNFYVASEMKALTPVCRCLGSRQDITCRSKDGELKRYYQRDWMEI